MANAGGQVGWDDVTVIGKRGPKGGSTLRTPQDVLSAQKKGLEVDTEKKCKNLLLLFMI